MSNIFSVSPFSNERYSIITKYHPETSTLNTIMQPTFSSMLALFVLLMTITLVKLPADAQAPFYQEKGYFDSTVFFLLDEFEYTFDIDGTQLIPNDTLKHTILTEYKHVVYNISRLQYKILDHTINASDVQIDVDPTRIDDMKTRFNIQIYADNAQVTGQWLTKTYYNLDLKSVYGIYDRATDNMVIHVPYSVALSLLLQ
jgi:hypothetical protein